MSNVPQDDVFESREFYEVCQLYRHAQDNGDAAKAFEILKDFIRAQRSNAEPVAWRLRIGDSDLWSYTETEDRADFYGKQSGLKYIKEPLYPPSAIEAAVREKLEEAAQIVIASRWLTVEQALEIAEPIRALMESPHPIVEELTKE